MDQSFAADSNAAVGDDELAAVQHRSYTRRHGEPAVGTDKADHPSHSRK